MRGFTINAERLLVDYMSVNQFSISIPRKKINHIAQAQNTQSVGLQLEKVRGRLSLL
jgi:hypothetical protein